MTAIPLQITPGLALLNIVQIPNPLKNVVINILMAARLTLVRHWKSRLVQAVEEVINLVQQYYSYEQMYASASNSLTAAIDK